MRKRTSPKLDQQKKMNFIQWYLEMSKPVCVIVVQVFVCVILDYIIYVIVHHYMLTWCGVQNSPCRVTLYPLHNPVFIPRTFFWPSEIGRRKGREDPTIMVIMLTSCFCICAAARQSDVGGGGRVRGRPVRWRWSSASKVDYKRWLPRDSYNSVETVVAVIGEVEWGKKNRPPIKKHRKTHTHTLFFCKIKKSSVLWISSENKKI